MASFTCIIALLAICCQHMLPATFSSDLVILSILGNKLQAIVAVTVLPRDQSLEMVSNIA